MNILDKHQQKIIKLDTNIKIIAGAGTGKTFSLIAKIKFLIKNKNVNPQEILIISFTNASVNDIKNKISYDVEILTFHKLALKILKETNFNFKLENTNLLNFIIYEQLRNIPKKQKHQILKYIKYDKNYIHFLNSKEYHSFTKFIIKFINLLKTNNYTISNLKNIKFTLIEKNILIIILNIYKSYLEEKKSTLSLDLDDIIVYATNSINLLNLKYKYIIVDEFQDTSMIRFNLINQIKKQTNAKLIVVGDDWQSIYRFTGCDLNLFLNLDKYILPLEVVKLEKNYRNSNFILKISKQFIEINKQQIKKNLYSENNFANPIVFVPYKNEYHELKNILEKLILTGETAFIISRNNNDIIPYLGKEIKMINDHILYRNTKFKYYTVHKSKGLECENIILLNCNNSSTGFPNKIEDDKIINKVFSNQEIKYAEERRLMYVALTRTKKKIYIFYNKNSPSIFVKEIKKIIKKSSK